MPNAEYLEYLKSPEWQEKRIAAVQAADYRCQVCNTPNHLDVHHRTYERFKNELPGDLTVLCRSCHELFHKTKREAIEAKKERKKRKKAKQKNKHVPRRIRVALNKLDPDVGYTRDELKSFGVPVSQMKWLTKTHYLRRGEGKWWRGPTPIDPPGPPDEPKKPTRGETRPVNRKDLEALAAQLGARIKEQSGASAPAADSR